MIVGLGCIWNIALRFALLSSLNLGRAVQGHHTISQGYTCIGGVIKNHHSILQLGRRPTELRRLARCESCQAESSDTVKYCHSLQVSDWAGRLTLYRGLRLGIGIKNANLAGISFKSVGNHPDSKFSQWRCHLGCSLRPYIFPKAWIGARYALDRN